MAPMRRKNLSGVLLDVDGTLIDSNDAHAQSWSETLAEFGCPTPVARVRPMIGMGGDKLLPALLGVDAESEEGKRFAKRRAEIFRQRYVPQLRLTRGAKELLERFRHEGLVLTIATSASVGELETMLRQVGLAGLVDKKTSSGDVEHSKPDPDVVRAALTRSGLEADEVVMLGDTPYDIEAAHRAGVEAVALLCGGWDADALRDANAIYEDPADLLRHFTASPFSCASSSPGRSETMR
ncbi:MAG TPA: HAD family hydrolase [Gemmatimonadaceae bacterium]|nr:HAD family hydrolase [Gemmatimonadaceae bacterium]